MKPNQTLTILFAGLLSASVATAAVAQTDVQDHDVHHPEQTQSAPPAPAGDSQPAAGMHGGMTGMGMMTPEMMQMMQRMMGQGAMPGMMGGMQSPEMTEGGMSPGMMACPMMQMMGADAMLYGMPRGKMQEMTPERVRVFLEQRLERHGNPRLKLGEIATTADGSITAKIVTVDGSLVQKLAFNRYPGLFRQITE